MRKFDVYNPYSNVSVTDFYVNIIEDAIKKCSFTAERINKMRFLPENDGIVIVHPGDYVKAKICGYKTVLLWVQGLIPEESYMRNHSVLRRAVLTAKEMPGIKYSDMILMVSARMKKHFEKKYGKDFADSVFLMPCFNAELDKSSFKTEGKYTRNVFTYTGGITAWQCFEQTVKLYSCAEKLLPDCLFKVYTPNKKEAEELLKKYNVKNYVIDFVSVQQLKEELKAVKYGFVLREENEVNYVATPTKLSTYLSSGVIPIFSSCIEDFKEAAKNMKYVIPLNSFESEELMEKITDINTDDIKKEYENLFDTYYNRDKYVSQLAEYIIRHIR